LTIKRCLSNYSTLCITPRLHAQTRSLMRSSNTLTRVNATDSEQAVSPSNINKISDAALGDHSDNNRDRNTCNTESLKTTDTHTHTYTQAWRRSSPSSQCRTRQWVNMSWVIGSWVINRDRLPALVSAADLCMLRVTPAASYITQT